MQRKYLRVIISCSNANCFAVLNTFFQCIFLLLLMFMALLLTRFKNALETICIYLFSVFCVGVRSLRMNEKLKLRELVMIIVRPICNISTPN